MFLKPFSRDKTNVKVYSFKIYSCCSPAKCLMVMMMMMNYIVVWLTDERRLALFPVPIEWSFYENSQWLKFCKKYCILPNRPKLRGNCVFPQNFHAKKLEETAVFFAVKVSIIFVNSIIHACWYPQHNFSVLTKLESVLIENLYSANLAAN